MRTYVPCVSRLAESNWFCVGAFSSLLSSCLLAGGALHPIPLPACREREEERLDEENIK